MITFNTTQFQSPQNKTRASKPALKNNAGLSQDSVSFSGAKVKDLSSKEILGRLQGFIKDANQNLTGRNTYRDGSLSHASLTNFKTDRGFGVSFRKDNTVKEIEKDGYPIRLTPFAKVSDVVRTTSFRKDGTTRQTIRHAVNNAEGKTTIIYHDSKGKPARLKVLDKDGNVVSEFKKAKSKK